MNFYEQIKNELIENEINRKVKNYLANRSDLSTYYNVGRLLSEAGKHYGEGIIKEYSKKLTNELGKGYSERNLRNIRQLCKISLSLKWQTLSAKLSYSHYCELLWLSMDEIKYYISICEKQNLSVRQLREKIKNKEYERLPNDSKNKLLLNNKGSATDFVKNPIFIKNNSNYEIISEKVLQKLILEDIPSFLDELGIGFTFVRNEYKVKIGDRYNYIDLLLYNIRFKCYAVIELKVTELKKEHIGQIQVYMNYIDKNLKTIDEDRTIGIIICKKDNKFVLEYSSDERIISKEYKVLNSVLID